MHKDERRPLGVSASHMFVEQQTWRIIGDSEGSTVIFPHLVPSWVVSAVPLRLVIVVLHGHPIPSIPSCIPCIPATAI